MFFCKCVIYWFITDGYLYLLAECPSSRHKPVIGLFRVRISVLIKPQTYRLCLLLSQPASLCWRLKAPNTFYYLLASTSAFLLLLLQPRPLHRSTKTRRPSPPDRSL